MARRLRPGLTKGRFPPKGAGGRSPWHVIPDGAVRNADDYASKRKRRLRVRPVGVLVIRRFQFAKKLLGLVSTTRARRPLFRFSV